MFASGETAGAVTELVFPASTLLAFYQVQDGTTQEYLQGGGDDPNVWSLFTVANSDNFDHFQRTDFENGVVQYNVEDQTSGGDQDFNDMVFTISAAPFEPGDETKFFVVDSHLDDTFRYDPDGTPIDSTDLAHHNNHPRGATSNVEGDRMWVADNSKRVFVYDADGDVLGQWRAKDARHPTGIATDGEDLWIVSKAKRRVYFYEDGTEWLSGNRAADSSFRLHRFNRHPSGIATDGENYMGQRLAPRPGVSSTTRKMETTKDGGLSIATIEIRLESRTILRALPPICGS